ncbi:hypothetical protein [Aestuariispira insulae]|nr:hypothetical protein [Aestuariispira insulae]
MMARVGIAKAEAVKIGAYNDPNADINLLITRQARSWPSRPTTKFRWN